MKLEQQVTSLELSKKLKELGVKQESLFYWVKTVVNEKENWDLRQQNPKSLEMSLQVMQIYGYCSAFTVAELGEMLPASIEVDVTDKLTDEQKRIRTEIGDSFTDVAWLSCDKTQNPDSKEGEFLWNCIYADEGEEKLDWIGGNTEADARAKMLIYLLENKFITTN